MKSDRRDALRRVLREHGPLTKPALAAKTGFPLDYVYEAVDGMVRTGELVNTAAGSNKRTRGIYALADRAAHDGWLRPEHSAGIDLQRVWYGYPTPFKQ